jgi:membrane-bound lytic murein transglycosylase B
MKGTEALRRGSLLLLLAALAGCAGPGQRVAAAESVPEAQAAPAPPAAPLPAPKPETPEQMDATFHAFLRDFRGDALRQGVRGETYDRATAGLTPNARVHALNESQPEFVRPVWDYLAGAVSDFRVMKGREALDANKRMFDTIEARYGVPREILAAIWGLETAYGQNQGSFNLFQSLATLAYDGPRQDYGRTQFIAALKIAEAEHIDPATMTGSWAGAVGHTQFIPTTFLSSAVDGDGDGKRDLWNSPTDALASAAAYLKRSGWQEGVGWGQEVLLPDHFPYAQADLDKRKSEAEWATMGLRTATGEALKGGALSEAVFIPAGARGPAFLLTKNFDAILAYNNATSYALAIGVLSDRLRGASGIIGSWPRDEQPLKRTDVIALQEGLEALGFSVGGVDGVLGRMTRDAVRAYQAAHDLPADGFATTGLITRILNERGVR